MKWTRSDYIKLAKAVTRFNKIVNEVKKTRYTPKEKSYKDIKSDILTRKEFNKILKSLKSATKENVSETAKFGYKNMSKWEIGNIKRNSRSAIATLKRQRIKFIKENISESKYPTWDSRIRTIDTNINSIKKLKEKEDKGDFLDTLKRVENYSNSREYRKDLNFMKMYKEEVLPQLENYENSEILIKKLNSIKSPKKFYELINESEVLKNLVQYYSNGDINIREALGQYAMSDEDAFDYAIFSELGLE